MEQAREQVFEVVYEQEDGWWFGSLAELPAIRSCGATRAEAAVRLRSLTAQWHEVAFADVLLAPASKHAA